MYYPLPAYPRLPISHKAIALCGIVFLVVSLLTQSTAVSPSLRGQTAQAPAMSEPDAATKQRVAEAYGKLPLYFEANNGQAGPDVKYVSRGSGHTLSLTSREAVLSLQKPSVSDGHGHSHATQPAEIRMQLVGGARKPVITSEGELQGKVNYFLGQDSSKWSTGVSTYEKVRYQGVYPGVDMVYYGNQQQLEYDFVVAPGADPRLIMLDFKGVRTTALDTNGDLLLHVGSEQVRQTKPFTYQEVDGRRQEIPSRYVLRGDNRIGFELGGYDVSEPLVIDPVLAFSTYLGGAGMEGLNSGIAIDPAGNVYVTGATGSTGFPIKGAIDTSCSPITVDPARCEDDGFVTKFNPAGSALIYSTFLGGSSSEYPGGIAVDAYGNAYAVGGTGSHNFPVTSNAYRTSHNKGECAFVQSNFSTVVEGCADVYATKLNPSGALVYSTYISNTSPVTANDDFANAVAVDKYGHAYITGETASDDFPVTNGSTFVRSGCHWQKHGSGDKHEFCEDNAFALKLNSTGSGLLYSTYLGGPGQGNGVDLNAAGNAYIAGERGGNAFVTKLSASGGPLYSKVFGGAAGDHANSIAVDGSGNAYVTGETGSTNFPVTAGAYDTNGGKGFIAKLNSTGAFTYSSYLNSRGWAIATDRAGNAYIAGDTDGTFPVTSGAFDSTHNGSKDVFVAKLNSTGSTLLYSSYLGGSSFDSPDDIAIDPAGNVYLVGSTDSSDFTTTLGAYDRTHNGGWTDAFVAKVKFDTTRPTVARIAPAAAATGVGRRTSVEAVFTEAMTAATITRTTFTLTKQGTTTPVTSTVTYDPMNSTAVLKPGTYLESGKTYTARIKGGTSGVKDLAGNMLGVDKVWSFTTAASTDVIAPTVSSTTPAAGATRVSRVTNIAAVFSEGMSATSLNTATFTVSKQGLAAPVAATVVYDAATRKVVLNPSADLESDVTYTATIKGGASGAKDAKGNPLATNKAWNFTVADTTAPTVTGVAPIGSATAEDAGLAGSNVVAVFSERMNATTVTTSSFTLVRQGTTTPISASVTYDAASRQATLNPSSNLVGGATYTATIKGGSTGVKDLAGNALATNKVWSFTVSDITPPTVTAVAPVASATGVLRGTNVEATFSEGMNATTISTSTFTLVGQGTTTPVAAAVSYDGTMKKAILNPTAALEEGVVYTATITGGATGVKDIVGNALAADKDWTFTVEDITPPDTSIFSGPSGTVDSTTAEFEFQATELSASFECSLDGAVFEPCLMNTTYYDLTEGTHTLRVRAKDGAGNVDATPASRSWTIELARDATPPMLSWAEVDGATLTLTYDEELDAASVPLPGAFEVTVNGVARTISAVEIANNVDGYITITLASPVTPDDWEITVSYTPGATPVQDGAGNDAAAFTDKYVENYTP